MDGGLPTLRVQEIKGEGGYWQCASPEEALEGLVTNGEKGLRQEEAAARLDIFGGNELPSRDHHGFAAMMRCTTVLRDGAKQMVDVAELVPGDIVFVQLGEKVPADLRVLEAESCRIDASCLTGDCEPVCVTAGIVPDGTSVFESHNMVLADCLCIQGNLRGLVVKTGPFTAVGRLPALVSTRKSGRGPAASRALVRQLMEENVLCKDRQIPFALAAATVLVCGTTGELTVNRMCVDTAEVADGYEEAALARALVMVSQPGDEEHGNSSMKACLEWAVRVLSLSPDDVASMRDGSRALATLRFSGKHKLVATVRQESGGPPCLYAFGASERVAMRCENCPVPPPAVADMSGRALRVLSVACKTLPGTVDLPDGEDLLEDGGDTADGWTYLGSIGMRDPPRPEAAATVQAAAEAGIRLVVASGDHPMTVKALLESIIPPAWKLRTAGGCDLVDMSDSELQETLQAEPGTVVALSRVTPSLRLRVVQALQAAGETVCMVGDGVSDSPALKAADVGVALGVAGTDVAKEAADMILLDDNLASLVAAAVLARTKKKACVLA